MGSTSATKSSHPATMVDKIKQLTDILKKLTASELRETILALCVPGGLYKGFVEEVTEQVQQLEAEKGRVNDQPGLPLHLLGCTNEELGHIIIRISRKNDVARKRANMMAERITAAKEQKLQAVKGRTTKSSQAPLRKR